MKLTSLSGNDKGLYATMKRWRIDPWLYGDICNVMPDGKIKAPGAPGTGGFK